MKQFYNSLIVVIMHIDELFVLNVVFYNLIIYYRIIYYKPIFYVQELLFEVQL